MKILPVSAEEFRKYGRVVDCCDLAPLIEKLKGTPRPADSVVYVPGEPILEDLPIAVELSQRLYGGMPLQIGYCNGSNRTLNCLEYHRGSEINVSEEDAVLLLAPLQEVRDNRIDTSKVEAFLLPAGTAVLLYETTLHYAPCNGPDTDDFRVVIVLPRGTNLTKPDIGVKSGEDRLLWAANKWLMAHPDSPEAAQGAFVGLTGDNIKL